MESKLITRKLSTEEQNELLNTLFGFELKNISDNDKPHFVLYDDDGEEFYASTENCQFDFSTLAGIFSYTANQAKKRGYSSCQFEMKKILGLN